jgi:hypothetical protein
MGLTFFLQQNLAFNVTLGKRIENKTHKHLCFLSFAWKKGRSLSALSISNI